MSADSKASNSKFLKGTLILTASSIVVKVIGSLNWIILSRVLGGEGIGLYQMGFPIYLMAITVSSAGVPVAISIITSEKLANKDYRGAFCFRPHCFSVRTGWLITISSATAVRIILLSLWRLRFSS